MRKDASDAETDTACVAVAAELMKKHNLRCESKTAEWRRIH